MQSSLYKGQLVRALEKVQLQLDEIREAVEDSSLVEESRNENEIGKKAGSVFVENRGHCGKGSPD